MRNLLLLPALLVLSIHSVAQSKIPNPNIIKYNVSGLLVKSHIVQYERVTSSKSSLALTVGFSPNTSLPFKDRLIELYGNDAQARSAIESTSFNKLTLTAEYRFYLSKKTPQGFYVAPFARYSTMSMEQNYSFVDSDNTTHNPRVKGTFTGFGGGVLLGSQWTLGSSVVLDLWLAGPFIGSQKAEFYGLDDRQILNTAGVEADIESIDLPLWDLDATVRNISSGGVQKGEITTTLKGPFLGVRMLGFSLGFRF